MAAAALIPEATNINHTSPTSTVRQNVNTSRESTDVSTLTSIFSDTVDRVPENQISTFDKSDIDGIPIYGRMDAGEDTGLSSVSSNGQSESHKSPPSEEVVHPTYIAVHNSGSRKRIALSPPEPEPNHAAVPVTQQPLLNQDATFSHSSSIANSRATHQSLSETGRTVTTPKLSKDTQLKHKFKPGTSIPTGLSWEEYGRQCVLAAQMSRLSPYALHPGEYRYLRDRMSHAYVTTYLNIRNGVLRLWTRNPMVSVSVEEAAGCAKESRFFELAVFAHKWLVRNGYINFGCVEVPRAVATPPRGRRSNKQQTIVVIGAGMSGLGCARQLEGLIAQLQDHWINQNEHPPRVVVLEGRKRIGGRVYSHSLRSQVTGSLPNDLRNTAEMGAQIITGFERGNPLEPIIRGQLGLHYHLMWDEIVLHDTDGKAVDHERDMLVNKIHNDLLERTSDFRVKASVTETLEGLPDFVDISQEPAIEEFADQDTGSLSTTLQNAVSTTGQERGQAVPPGFAKLQGRTQVVAGNSSSRTAAQAAKAAGWELRPGISRNHSLNLEDVVQASDKPTLGATMNEAVRQYRNLVELTPQDMRLLNWHYADLEYANSANVHNLSLGGHDQDSGNEFEGRHSEVVGGYIQVPRGLMMLPHQLDVQFDSTVKKITYSPTSKSQAKVECHNGNIVEADHVVLTSPLGVLKAQAIEFSPPLPEWKQGAIDRMGFGLLNKVVLVFERPFWDENFDMFGFLNESEKQDSMDPDDYMENRGRFYMIWNCLKNSGRPVLSALMAGKAAHAAEVTDTETLVKEVTARLAKTFAPQPVPAPIEVIVTRWKKDPYTRGTYSFVSPETQPGDYDVMALPVGNLHFAGEATCGTHPATVHGAYLSGLRAASDVIETMIGPIDVPDNLIGPKQVESHAFEASLVPRDMSGPNPTPLKFRIKKMNTGKPGRPPKVKQEDSEPAMLPAVTPQEPATPHVNPYRSVNSIRSSANEEYEALIASAIMSEIGGRPLKPARPGVNPFLVYTAEKWNECKEESSEEKRRATGSEDAKATRNEIRIALGKKWRNLSEEVKRPYVEQSEAAQLVANEARAEYEKSVAEWDKEARRIRMVYVQENPAPET
ncbi:hypothetical protein MBLNU457_7754t2 [Dothideomycetes sp. NU457]